MHRACPFVRRSVHRLSISRYFVSRRYIIANLIVGRGRSAGRRLSDYHKPPSTAIELAIRLSGRARGIISGLGILHVKIVRPLLTSDKCSSSGNSGSGSNGRVGREIITDIKARGEQKLREPRVDLQTRWRSRLGSGMVFKRKIIKISAIRIGIYPIRRKRP